VTGYRRRRRKAGSWRLRLEELKLHMLGIDAPGIIGHWLAATPGEENEAEHEGGAARLLRREMALVSDIRV
jgi:hypothetical protein